MSVITSEQAPEISYEIYHRPVTKKSLRRRLLLFSLLASSLCAAAHAAQSVTLAWGADSDPSTVGYIVHYGLVSGNYSSQTNVGANTSVTIGGLVAGMTNYFVVGAYNSAGVEGPPSSQISYLAPGAIQLTSAEKSGKKWAVNMQFSVAVGHWYQVQASTDLNSWMVIGQTPTNTANTWYTFQDSQSAALPKRFYRLAMH